MSTVPRAGFAALLVVTGLLAAQSGGAMTVTGDREADVVTAADGAAYLAIEPYDRHLPHGRHGSVVLLELRNYLPAPLLSIMVTVVDGDPKPPRLQSTSWPNSLVVGERGKLVAAIVCGGPSGRTERWRLQVVARGVDSAVTLSRTVEISCEVPAGTGPSGPRGTNAATPAGQRTVGSEAE